MTGKALTVLILLTVRTAAAALASMVFVAVALRQAAA
jgi:hypothetical protein